MSIKRYNPEPSVYYDGQTYIADYVPYLHLNHVDSCIDCNNDYVVTTHNQIRCPECSEKTRAKYVRDAVKRNG